MHSFDSDSLVNCYRTETRIRVFRDAVGRSCFSWRRGDPSSASHPAIDAGWNRVRIAAKRRVARIEPIPLLPLEERGRWITPTCTDGVGGGI